MNFYNTIAQNYNDIFPYKPQQFNFILKSINNEKFIKKATLLDIGCGTGLLAVKCAERFKNVVGIDLDKEMLKKTEIFNQPNLNFLEMDMTKISQKFPKESFDVITCFGNTLVHLKDLSEIDCFFRNTSGVLKNSGHFLLQIVNYDRILEKNIKSLPTIENEKIRFVREYRINENNKIDFITKLLDKNNQRQFENSIELFPIRKKDLEKLLIKNGFGNIHFYSDFNFGEYNIEKIPLVLSAKKI